MGANRRNKFGTSRRFAVCYELEHDQQYQVLLANYQASKSACQNSGREGHELHVRNIIALNLYISSVEKKHWREEYWGITGYFCRMGLKYNPLHLVG